MLVDKEPEKVAALLRAYRKAQDFINKNPEKAVDITSYNYPSYEQRKAAAFNVKDDVHYFAKQLNDIGYLTTDADSYTAKYFVDLEKYI